MELLQVVENVAREKRIPSEEVFMAMETALHKAARSKYGFEYDIRATIDRKTGEIELFRFREVVEDIENEATQILLDDAQHMEEGIQLGGFIKEQLPPIEFGRVAAQTARQVIIQGVRDAERHRQYEEYKDKVGEVINGIVKRIEYGNITIDIGSGEAIIRRDQLIPREKYKPGDRVRAYIQDVREELKGPQIFLSRTDPMFMVRLFTQEVPEIYDGVIEIKSVARDPGSRAKISVYTEDPSIDPVGACVGLRGNRVQAVVGELQGERIDIVPYTEDTATFVVNALAPAEVSKIIVNEKNDKLEVVVPDDQLSLAIGRRGQNVRLASILTGWAIDILTESQESEKRSEEFKERSGTFIEALDIDDVIAHLLVTEGFEEIEDVAYIETSELANIEGFDEDIAAELQQRAKDFIEARQKEIDTKLKKLKIKKDLIGFEGLTPDHLVKLGENNVKSLDDFADLAGDELLEILGPKFTVKQTNEMIMKAREHWFAEEDQKADEEAEKESEENKEAK